MQYKNAENKLGIKETCFLFLLYHVVKKIKLFFSIIKTIITTSQSKERVFKFEHIHYGFFLLLLGLPVIFSGNF